MEEAKEITIEEKEIKEGAPFAALSYILFLWVFAFIFKKNNEFAHYHARQGLVIFIGEVIAVFFLLVPFLGGILYRLAMLILFIFSMYGIVSSLTGKLCKIPVISEISSKLVI